MALLILLKKLTLIAQPNFQLPLFRTRWHPFSVITNSRPAESGVWNAPQAFRAETLLECVHMKRRAEVLYNDNLRKNGALWGAQKSAHRMSFARQHGCGDEPREGRQKLAQGGTGVLSMHRLCACWGGGSPGCECITKSKPREGRHKLSRDIEQPMMRLLQTRAAELLHNEHLQIRGGGYPR